MNGVSSVFYFLNRVIKCTHLHLDFAKLKFMRTDFTEAIEVGFKNGGGNLYLA